MNPNRITNFLFLAILMLHSCKKSDPASLVIPDNNPPLTNIPGRTYTLAGGTQGLADGIRLYAKLNNPNGIAVDANGNLFVADQANNVIRKITAEGVVTTIAGSGTIGHADGLGAKATFNNPIGIAIDRSGNLFITDSFNNLIRKINPAGEVTTFAGSGSIGFDDGPDLSATFNGLLGIAIDNNNNIFVVDNSHVIRKITQTGYVSTFAGYVVNNTGGFVNGTGSEANFDSPCGLAVDADNNLYVADYSNNMIRKITPDAVVTTFAGQLNAGSTDGTATSATFYQPYGVTVDAAGNVYVSDGGNNKIRRITPSGQVTTVAGTGAVDGDNGDNLLATFTGIRGLAVDADANIFVADGYSKIRKIIQKTQ